MATGNDVTDASYRTKVSADLLEPMGADTLVWTKFAGHELRFRMDGQVKLSEGQEVEIGLSAELTSVRQHDGRPSMSHISLAGEW